MTAILPSQLAAELLRQGKTVRLRAEGGSMRPWLQPGRLVTVEPVPGMEALKVGDVILTLTEGRAMLHRVIQISPCVITKGDSLGYFDPAPEAVLGRAVGLSSPPVALLSRLFQPAQRVLRLLGILVRRAYDRSPA